MEKYLSVIFNLAGFALLIVAIVRFVVDAFKQRKQGSLKRLVPYLIACILLIEAIYIVNNHVDKPSFSDAGEIDYCERIADYQCVSEKYLELLKDDPENLDYHFGYVDAYYRFVCKWAKNRHLSISGTEIQEYYYGKRIVKYYTSHRPESAISHLFLGLHYTNLQNYTKAQEELNKINNSTLKYYNYTLGKYHQMDGDYNLSDSLLKREISDSAFVKGAYSELANLYYYYREIDELKKLVYDDNASEFIELFLKRSIYFHEADLVNYVKIVFKRKIDSAYLWGVIAALLITAIWVIYLRKLDIYEKEKWRHVVLVFILSCITIFLVYPISDFMWQKLNFYMNGKMVNDFFYCVIGIGGVEELVKIIPVLIVLWFTRAINEPFDYILYGSISALGFAFVENIGYIGEPELYNINARMFMAAIAHMFFTSVICYGMLLNKYRYSINPFINFLIFYALAAFAHGFYDFWLINHSAAKYSVLSSIFFLICIHIWFTMKNNAINISVFYSPEKKINNNKLKAYLTLSFFAIIIYSYVAYSLQRGSAAGNQLLLSQLFLFAIFIVYILMRFSRYTIIRGYLAPLKVPLMFIIPKLEPSLDYTETKVTLYRSKRLKLIKRYSKEFSSILPVHGTITGQRALTADKNWHIVKLDAETGIENHVQDHVLIKVKKGGFSFSPGSTALISVLLIPSIETLEKNLLKRRDFKELGWAVVKCE